MSLLFTSPAMGTGRPGGQEFPSVFSAHECAASCQLAQGSAAWEQRLGDVTLSFPSFFKPRGILDTDWVTIPELPSCHVFSRCSTPRAREHTISGCWFPDSMLAIRPSVSQWVYVVQAFRISPLLTLHERSEPKCFRESTWALGRAGN